MTDYSPTEAERADLRRAEAYVNWSRWVADCPYGCGSAELVLPGHTEMHCSFCGKDSGLAFPRNAMEIYVTLLERTRAEHRNWYPDGHPVGTAAGAPCGQSCDDLRAENSAQTEVTGS